ncbi:MAG: hypothetical protein JXQ30_01885 [Spirochaetes bacterium]|nr:hypothetical protein [Spirochaetota bacterium]
MSEKVLCFSLNGFTLAVDPDQVEKILINKHPGRESFILETGVEVRSLKSYIPLPEREKTVPAENILFIKDQKDYYGFTVDRIVGYLTLKGAEKESLHKPDTPIQYFIRKEGMLIPVMDLQYVTNNENSVGDDDIEEIVSTAGEDVDTEPSGTEQEMFEEVSRDEIFSAIDEEISKNKQLGYTDEAIHSEKKGVVLPLLVNIAIVAVFLAGFLFYLTTSRERVRDQEVAGSISGVEEEVIREIQRKSEEEVAEQKEKLRAARSRLQTLQQEKENFLKNQDVILAQKEDVLREAYEKRLAEAQQRIRASGSEDADAEFEAERERLYQEFLRSTTLARQEIDDVKAEYEEALRRQESEIRQEVDVYSKRIGEIEQRLKEEQVKLKESEERFQSTVQKQQEYETFRRQLNTVYNRALNAFSRRDYETGISELKTIPPIIDKAKKSGIGDDTGLGVEEKLADNLLYLAQQEKNRIDLNQMGRETYRAAGDLEKSGNLKEALSRYFTAYTVSNDGGLKQRAYVKAEAIMDRLYGERSNAQSMEVEEKAQRAFERAMAYKNEKRYGEALDSLHEVVTEHGGSSKSRDALDEIVEINELMSKEKEASLLLDRNGEASKIMDQASESYERGYYAEALTQYQDVLERYGDTDHAKHALDEVVRINDEMREFQAKPQITMRGPESGTGVVIQALTQNSLLFSLGSEDNVKSGEIMQLYRKEGSSLVFIGSLKVTEVYPTISRATAVYYERKPQEGDIVTF